MKLVYGASVLSSPQHKFLATPMHEADCRICIFMYKVDSYLRIVVDLADDVLGEVIYVVWQVYAYELQELLHGSVRCSGCVGIRDVITASLQQHQQLLTGAHVNSLVCQMPLYVVVYVPCAIHVTYEKNGRTKHNSEQKVTLAQGNPGNKHL